MKLTASESGKLGGLASAATTRALLKSRIERYNLTPNCCYRCKDKLPYKKRHNKYCSRTCSCLNNNNRKNTGRIIKVNKPCLMCDKDTTNAKYCCSKCQGSHKQKLLTEEWLATGNALGSGHQTHYIRNYIRTEQSNLCDICNHPPEWMGSPIVFILDHINGDSTNNHRDNLRLVCPMCDSQLPTYKNKNAGKGRHSRRERYHQGKSY